MKDYMDQSIFCESENQRITIRATRTGAIVCKYPWQKCPTRKKHGSDPDKCIMSRMIRDLPAEIEKRKKEFSDNILQGLITWVLLKRKLKD